MPGDFIIASAAKPGTESTNQLLASQKGHFRKYTFLRMNPASEELDFDSVPRCHPDEAHSRAWVYAAVILVATLVLGLGWLVLKE